MVRQIFKIFFEYGSQMLNFSSNCVSPIGLSCFAIHPSKLLFVLPFNILGFFGMASAKKNWSNGFKRYVLKWVTPLKFSVKTSLQKLNKPEEVLRKATVLQNRGYLQHILTFQIDRTRTVHLNDLERHLKPQTETWLSILKLLHQLPITRMMEEFELFQVLNGVFQNQTLYLLILCFHVKPFCKSILKVFVN